MPSAEVGSTGLLAGESIRLTLTDPVLDAMSLLNEIAARFPRAISLAPGWPPDDHFSIGDIDRYLRRYANYLRVERGMSADEVRRNVFQYGPSAGTIRELVARFLARVEGIRIDPEAVLMTTGCQEAMLVVLRALCGGPEDVLLVQSPCYFGVTGAAKILGIPTHPVPERARGLEPEDVGDAARLLRARGSRPRALYVMPDYANPSGHTLSQTARDRLREVAAEQELILLEDSPYRSFARSDRRLPTLKSADVDRSVIFLGSFSKVCFPGARVGFVVADQQVGLAGRPAGLFAAHLAKIKSMVSVNTSPLAQAVVGGMLLESDFALMEANSSQIATAKERMETMLRQLHLRFGPLTERHSGIGWNEPGGGFFVVLRLPFTADIAALEDSAARFGVLWTPMSLFYQEGGGREIRLASSYATPEEITCGIERLSNFVLDRLT